MLEVLVVRPVQAGLCVVLAYRAPQGAQLSALVRGCHGPPAGRTLSWWINTFVWATGGGVSSCSGARPGVLLSGGEGGADIFALPWDPPGAIASGSTI
jgi:hypothetical protein